MPRTQKGIQSPLCLLQEVLLNHLHANLTSRTRRGCRTTTQTRHDRHTQHRFIQHTTQQRPTLPTYTHTQWRIRLIPYPFLYPSIAHYTTQLSYFCIYMPVYRYFTGIFHELLIDCLRVIKSNMESVKTATRVEDHVLNDLTRQFSQMLSVNSNSLNLNPTFNVQTTAARIKDILLNDLNK